MNTYCLKCKKKKLLILILKWLKQKIIDYLCSENVMFVRLKSQDL